MDERLNDTIPVRPGEELPAARLEDYLRSHLPDAPGPLSVRQFAGGHSNLTYLLRLGDTELVLRRPPFGNAVKSAHDMAREYRVLSKLSPVYPPAPRPLLFCDDPAVMDVPFYVMERRRGVILRKQGPADLSIDAATAQRLSTSLIDALANLHALDYQAAGLGDVGKPEGYVARQVNGWVERYAKAQTSEVPALDRTARWLTGRLPSDSAPTLIHNDFKYDNLVLDQNDLTRVTAVLDWEMATVGDPLMDLGTTLGYWVEAGDPAPLRLAAMGPTDLPGSLTRRSLADHYADRTGRDVTGILFYYVFGLYKIAVIVQQIYARYIRGHTRDPRFARLDGLVAVLAQQADRAVGTERL
jgi:aminoglycoside phosphotransferase (APT) family kinase protein